MPAVSRKQQRFFGMVRQAQKEGQAKAASPEIARVAASIKKKDAKDFIEKMENEYLHSEPHLQSQVESGLLTKSEMLEILKKN